MEQQPLCTLAREKQQLNKSKMDSTTTTGGSFVWAVIWFLIIAVIVWLILIAVRPSWVMVPSQDGTPSTTVDQGKAVLWAILIAFIISVIIWLLVAWSGYGAAKTAVVYTAAE